MFEFSCPVTNWLVDLCTKSTVLKVSISRLNVRQILLICLNYSLESFKVFHCSVINVLCCLLPFVAVSFVIIARCILLVNNFFYFFHFYKKRGQTY
jgi:hypothetical protein